MKPPVVALFAAAALCAIAFPGCGRISRALQAFSESESAEAADVVPNTSLSGGRVHAVSGDDLPGLIAQRDRLVIVDFYADWCPPCKMLAPVLENIAASYSSNVLIVKIDTEKYRRDAQDYGVRSIPDVRFFLNGREIHQFTGFMPEPDLRKLVTIHSNGLPTWEPSAVAATPPPASQPPTDAADAANDGSPGWLAQMRDKVADRLPSPITDDAADAQKEITPPIRPIDNGFPVPTGMQRRTPGSAPPTTTPQAQE